MCFFLECTERSAARQACCVPCDSFCRPLPRLALLCSDLKLREAAALHEDAVGQAYIGDTEQARCVQPGPSCVLLPRRSVTPSRGRSHVAEAPCPQLRSLHTPAPTAQRARTVGVGKTQGYRAQGIRVWGALLGCSFLLTLLCAGISQAGTTRGEGRQGTQNVHGSGCSGQGKGEGEGEGEGAGSPSRLGWSPGWMSRAGGQTHRWMLESGVGERTGEERGSGVLCGAAGW